MTLKPKNLIGAALLLLNSFSQTPLFEWANSISGEEYQEITDIIVANDGKSPANFNQNLSTK